MTFEERLRLIKKLDGLIKRKYKGNSSEYARKLNVSDATFFRLLEYVKTEFDAPISYCKKNGYYEYCRSGIMFFGFLPVEILTEEGMKKIQAGITSYMSNSVFSKIFFPLSIGESDETYL